MTKETGAADIPAGFQASLRFQRKSNNADVTAVCMGQALESVNSARFAGHTAEFDFLALAGANFSAATNNVQVTVQTGTGTDQSTVLQAAGTWTGAANAVQINVPITATWTRYTVVAAIPATATQVGVKLCYTPVGTAGANDWLETTGLQLAVNDSLVAAVGTQLATVAGQALSFEYRPTEVEFGLAERSFYRITETNGGAFGLGIFASTNVPQITIPLPVTMRAVPAVTVAVGGFSFRINGATSAATGGGFAAAGATVQTTSTITVVGTNTGTVSFGVQLLGTATTGTISASAEL